MKWNDIIDFHIKKGDKIAVVIGVSAGKDSTAVALIVKNKYPDLFKRAHLVFADTGSELPETYEYLDRISKNFGKEVVRIVNRGGTLEQIIENFGGYLPSPMSRYCTRLSKISPFRDYMDALAKEHDIVFNLVGIRSDEPTRSGFEPCGQYAQKIKTLLPLKDELMKLEDVFALVTATVGVPEYYKWRTRSGCYFCFYQRRIEWVNLKEKHPDLFEKAKTFEKTNEDGKRFTWIKDMSLDELEAKADKIKARYLRKLKKLKGKNADLSNTDSEIFEKLMNELEPDLAQNCTTCR